MNATANTRLVWRLESKDGKGIYAANGDELPGVVGEYEGWDYNHAPGPIEDGPRLSHYLDSLSYDDQKKVYFAFKDLEQLKQWFDEPADWDLWSKHHFQLALYRVDATTTVDGGHQVAIRLSDKPEEQRVRVNIKALHEDNVALEAEMEHRLELHERIVTKHKEAA